MPGTRLIVAEANRGQEDSEVEAADQAAAVDLLIERLGHLIKLANIAVVGHRVVHGGNGFFRPELITPEVLEELRQDRPLRPRPPARRDRGDRGVPASGSRAASGGVLRYGLPSRPAARRPDHSDPRRYEAAGVRRYGFHGLSYAYLMEELARVAGPEAARGRVILAHLGSGASLAAVREGRCIETTMGFTPTSGLVMGTRCGDIDPGLVRVPDAGQGADD